MFEKQFYFIALKYEVKKALCSLVQRNGKSCHSRYLYLSNPQSLSNSHDHQHPLATVWGHLRLRFPKSPDFYKDQFPSHYSFPFLTPQPVSASGSWVWQWIYFLWLQAKIRSGRGKLRQSFSRSMLLEGDILGKNRKHCILITLDGPSTS